jgi:hypothetical protein
MAQLFIKSKGISMDKTNKNMNTKQDPDVYELDLPVCKYCGMHPRYVANTNAHGIDNWYVECDCGAWAVDCKEWRSGDYTKE